MKKAVSLVLITVLCLNFLCGCASDYTACKNKYSIVTTVFAAYDFARQVGGDEVNVTLLLKPGTDSHSYEPTPADIVTISECDMFIYTGGENDAWIDDILESIDNPDMTIIKMLDCVTVKYTEEAVEGMQVRDDDEGFDEHVWMSPKNAALISQSIAKGILSDTHGFDIDGDKIQNLLSDYLQQLDELDAYTRNVIENATGDTVIFGDRFPVRYYMEEYGLKYYAAFPGCSDDAQASAATMAYLIDKAKELDCGIIFKIELSSDDTATAIAEETGARVETFYTCHNLTKGQFEEGETYISLMYHNADIISEALNYGTD